jgi:hypothetical protein
VRREEEDALDMAVGIEREGRSRDSCVPPIFRSFWINWTNCSKTAYELVPTGSSIYYGWGVAWLEEEGEVEM